jgi:hypothetical protein
MICRAWVLMRCISASPRSGGRPQVPRSPVLVHWPGPEASCREDRLSGGDAHVSSHLDALPISHRPVEDNIYAKRSGVRGLALD